MADQNQTSNPVGMPAPIAPMPEAPTGDVSSTNLASAAAGPSAPAPAPTGDSNTPETDTQAGASIPKKLINDPQFPSQQAATKVDLNKTSPAPHHSWLYKAAQELSGGPVMRTSYTADGTAVREEVPVSLPHLGLALAMEAIRGGLAGASAPKGQEAAAGANVVAQDRAKQKQAMVEQDAQAKSDQNHKLAVTETNMRIYQTAVNVGKASKETSQSFADSFKPISEGLQDGSIVLPEGVTKEEAFETDAMASIVNGKTNITHDIMIPVGEAQPIIDPNTKQQAIVNGAPAWGHTYMTIHGADKFQTVLTKDMQDKLHEIGMFQEGGKNANIGEPQWSFADIMKKMSVYASVKAGEQLLQDHKNDAHDLLGREAEDLDDMSASVRKDPMMRKAVGLFAQAQQGTSGANSHIEDILNTMASKDPQAASTLMHYLKLSPKDLDDMHNKRVEAATEATTKEPQAKPLTPEAAAELKARTDLLKQEEQTSGANKKKIDAETDKLLKDDAGQADLTDMIGKGQIALARLDYILSRKPEILEKVTAKYPDFDASKAQSYPKAYIDYTNQKRGSAGAAINSGGTAFQHLEELLALNTNASHFPGTPAYTAYKNKMDTVVSELGQFYGNTTIPGLQDFKDTLSATLPGNREAAIRTQAKSMGDKMNSYEHGWLNAAPSEVYQHPLPGLSHEALVSRAKLDPTFKNRPPEGAKGQATFNGKPFWVNAKMIPLQEVIQ